jgi:hypothetical protein
MMDNDQPSGGGIVQYATTGCELGGVSTIGVDGEATFMRPDPGVCSGTYTISSQDLSLSSTASYTMTFEAPPMAPVANDDFLRASPGLPFSINLLGNDNLGNPTAVFRITIDFNDCDLSSSPDSGVIAGTCGFGEVFDATYSLENSEGSDDATVAIEAPQ